jgi:hypothetical protein
MDIMLSSLNSKQSNELSLESEITSALKSLLSQFKDQKKGLRILSSKIGIHEKTLNRILNFENKPSYQTIFKIYRVVFNEYNDAKILELVPSIVKDFLIKNNSQELNSEKNYTTLADSELQKNPIVAEIYIWAATGPIKIEDIEVRFGNYGIELISKMIEKSLLREIHKNVFITGNNYPTFSGQTIVSVGSAMVNSHAKPTNGEELSNNFLAFYAEGLSPKAFDEWLKIDEEANRKKCDLTRDPKNLGPIRAFTFMVTEKIELNKLH